MVFNEILNSMNEIKKISWNRIPDNFSLGFSVTEETVTKKHKTKTPTKHCPIFTKTNTKRSTLSTDEVRKEKPVQTTAKCGVHFSVMKKQLMDETVRMPSSPYNTQNSFISLLH